MALLSLTARSVFSVRFKVRIQFMQISINLVSLQNKNNDIISQ